MVLPFESLKARVYRLDASRRASCVEDARTRYARWLAGGLSLNELCAEVGDLLERYAMDTLDSWLGAVASSRGIDLQRWLMDEYPESVGQAANAIRDVIDDRNARHAVAQNLQTGVLQAQAHLHQVLDTRLAADRQI